MRIDQENIEQLLKEGEGDLMLANRSLESLMIRNFSQKIEQIVFIDCTFMREAEFINIAVKSFISFNQCSFKGFTSLSKLRIDGDIIFEQCSFRDTVLVRDLHIQGEIVFNDCTFKDDALIDNLYREGDSKNTFPIIKFSRCKFKYGLNLLKTNIQWGVLIEDCDIKEVLSIQVEGCNGNLEILRNTINSFDIDHSKLNGAIVFQQNKIAEDSKIRNVSCNSLYLEYRNIFEGEFEIVDCNIENEISCFGNEFKDDVEFAKTTGELNIDDCTFFGIASITYHEDGEENVLGPRNIFIEGSGFSKGLTIDIDNEKSEVLSKQFVEGIELSLSANSTGTINVLNLHLGRLIVSGYNAKTNLHFDKLIVRHVILEELINYGGIIFSYIRPSAIPLKSIDNEGNISQPSWLIKGSNLGKTQFNAMDFTWFPRIKVWNAILADCSGALVSWFSPHQLDRNDADLLEEYKAAYRACNEFRYKLKCKIESFSAKYTDLFNLQRSKKPLRIRELKLMRLARRLRISFQNRQEVYRQLKFVSEKQGDRPKALEFQRWEMHYYRQQIRLDPNAHFPEKFILWTNLTNNFGQDWRKAALLFALVSFFFYCLFALGHTNTLDWQRPAASWDDVRKTMHVLFSEQIRFWFVQLNPTHSFRDLEISAPANSGGLYFLDFLSRIVSAFFLFQIVSAFRKFSR